MDRIASVAGGRLMVALRQWTEAGGRWTPEIYGQLQRIDLLENTIACSMPPTADKLIVEWWGNRRDLFGLTWCRMAPGRELLEQPNRPLAEWYIAASSRLAAAGQPRLLACDIVVRTPDRRLVRRTFKRLALPWRTAGGAVITATDLAQSTIVLEKAAAAH